MCLYDFCVKTAEGGEKALGDYRGRVALIVNTATGCVFTPQYRALQALYEACRDRGLEILDFPCDQFAGQAPGSDREIHEYCAARFGITFPQFARIDVRGENAHPLYVWLSENTRFGGFSGVMAPVMRAAARAMDRNYKRNSAVKWNFTKFLIGRGGEILARFEPTVEMKTVAAQVEAAL